MKYDPKDTEAPNYMACSIILYYKIFFPLSCALFINYLKIIFQIIKRRHKKIEAPILRNFNFLSLL